MTRTAPKSPFASALALAFASALVVGCGGALPEDTPMGDDESGAIADAELGSSASASTAAMQWGPFSKGPCVTQRSRKWSAVLWNIPFGQSWDAACKSLRGAPNGIAPRVPDKCETFFVQWGEWYLDDPTCRPTYQVPRGG